MEKRPNKQSIHWVSSGDSLEFAYFSWSLSHSSIIALDAEWKPFRTRQPSFPTVSLLQIACRIANCDSDSGSPVFLLDLSSLHLPSIYQILKDSLISPNVLKLGFGFKHDLMYLSSTFCSKGCDPGFDRVEPFIDAMSLYNYLQLEQSVEQKVSKQSKSLASICKELLGIELSKELQCSDWSQRPLSQEQKEYAAADAQCLLEIFDVFKGRIQKEGQPTIEAIDSEILLGTNAQMDVQLEHVISKYGDTILLKDSDRKPKVYKQKEKKQKAKKCDAGMTHKQRQLASTDDWQGPPPWDLSLGGDGCPKFLCDVMVEGLARHLRCVGIDAAIPHSKKPDTRDLIEHAYKEKRVILTRDAKLSKHGYLIRNQIYRVKNLLKNEQLVEVIETFQLNICEGQLMSRCTKCNGRFIQKPLSTEEALEAAKGFQQIPKCLFNKNLEFWKCMDCNQLYWEGTQYHNALQKFIDVCKLN